MPFPRRLLNDREEVVLDLRPHWWFLSGPGGLLVAALLGLIVLASAGADDWVQLAVAGVVVAALAWFAGRYARWATTNFVVTTDRLIYRSGVIAKRGIEIPLERVNTVFSSQTVFERLLRSGDLVIESAGERGQQAFSDISRPAEVQNEIYRQIEDNHHRMFGGGRATPAAPSVPDQLEKLDELRRRGVITQAEFDAKKAQLLDRM